MLLEILVNSSKKIFNENNLHEVVEALDKGYDTPRAMWTKLMRQEVLLILDKECFNIQEQWDKCHQNEIDLSHPTIMWDTKQEKEIPAFPEIEESLRIDDIFLNNFNKMPLADKNVRKNGLPFLIILD